ncbi:MAG TPA: phage portal protein, partial [Thermoguttaceae bacterium]|nr:phage portal protein [Thermoguttaceae bacterium]
MIGTALDHVISWFSPARAARRASARNVFSGVSKRGYDAAKLDRTNSAWRTANTSPDLELEASGRIRARARDLVRNNAYAKGVVRALVRNVVGTGIKLQSRIEGAEPLNKSIEQLFNRWTLVSDAAGRLTFEEIQRLAFQEVIEAGECLIHFTRLESDRGRPVSLALEMIDADRLADDMQTRKLSMEGDNEIRRGVEVNALGRPVAYWIYRTHPNDINSTMYRTFPERVPAEECLHLYKSERIGQTRGVSLFAPVVGWLKQLGYYVDNELQASAVSSCFTAAITT